MKSGLRRLAWCVLAAACACGDAHGGLESPQPDAATQGPQPDAAAPESQPEAAVPPQPDAPSSAFDAAGYEASLAARPPHAALPRRELTTIEADWAAASDFEIEFQIGGICFGACPEYSLTFFANGELHFTGYNYTWKPGTYVLSRSAADAKTLYQNLILLGFLEFPEACETRDDWHTFTRANDGPTLAFGLRAGGRERTVTNVRSCSGKLAHHDALFPLRDEILAATAVEPYLDRGSTACSDHLDDMTFRSGFVLLDKKKEGVGLLRLMVGDRRWEWSTTTCDGKPFASGHVIPWGCDAAMLPADEPALRWPALDVRPAAAVLRDVHAGRTQFPITLYTFDQELHRRARSGTHCE